MTTPTPEQPSPVGSEPPAIPPRRKLLGAVIVVALLAVGAVGYLVVKPAPTPSTQSFCSAAASLKVDLNAITTAIRPWTNALSNGARVDPTALHVAFAKVIDDAHTLAGSVPAGPDQAHTATAFNQFADVINQLDALVVKTSTDFNNQDVVAAQEDEQQLNQLLQQFKALTAISSLSSLKGVCHLR